MPHNVPMTKRHFIAIAAILKSEHSPGQSSQAVAIRLADYFANENPRFDRQRFLTACGF